MSDTNKNTTTDYAAIGRKGGQVKGVKKGFAWLKKNDPERFNEIIRQGVEARTKANRERKAGL